MPNESNSPPATRLPGAQGSITRARALVQALLANPHLQEQIHRLAPELLAPGDDLRHLLEADLARLTELEHQRHPDVPGSIDTTASSTLFSYRLRTHLLPDVDTFAPNAAEAAARIDAAWASAAPDLDLSWQYLGSMPRGLSSLNQLRTLNISGNALESLPDGIERLRLLEALDASANDLAQLPASLGELNQLRDLSINHNELDTFPTVISTFEAGVTVNVAGNPFTAQQAAQLQIEQCRAAGQHIIDQSDLRGDLAPPPSPEWDEVSVHSPQSDVPDGAGDALFLLDEADLRASTSRSTGGRGGGSANVYSSSLGSSEVSDFAWRPGSRTTSAEPRMAVEDVSAETMATPAYRAQLIGRFLDEQIDLREVPPRARDQLWQDLRAGGEGQTLPPEVEDLLTPEHREALRDELHQQMIVTMLAQAAHDHPEDDHEIRAAQRRFAHLIVGDTLAEWRDDAERSGLTHEAATDDAISRFQSIQTQCPEIGVFLSRLPETADAQQNPLAVISRASDILNQLHDRGPLRDRVLDRLADSVGECGDRIGFGLDNAEIEIDQWTGTRPGASSLEQATATAARMYRLEQLDQYARDYAREMNWQDEELEYVMQFRIQARQCSPEFIPGTCCTMHYAGNFPVPASTVTEAMARIMEREAQDEQRMAVLGNPLFQEYINATGVPAHLQAELDVLHAERERIAALTPAGDEPGMIAFAERIHQQKTDCERRVSELYARIVEVRAPRDPTDIGSLEDQNPQSLLYRVRLAEAVCQGRLGLDGLTANVRDRLFDDLTRPNVDVLCNLTSESAASLRDPLTIKWLDTLKAQRQSTIRENERGAVTAPSTGVAGSLGLLIDREPDNLRTARAGFSAFMLARHFSREGQMGAAQGRASDIPDDAAPRSNSEYYRPLLAFLGRLSETTDAQQRPIDTLQRAQRMIEHVRAPGELREQILAAVSAGLDGPADLSRAMRAAEAHIEQSQRIRGASIRHPASSGPEALDHDLDGAPHISLAGASLGPPEAARLPSPLPAQQHSLPQRPSFLFPVMPSPTCAEHRSAASSPARDHLGANGTPLTTPRTDYGAHAPVTSATSSRDDARIALAPRTPESPTIEDSLTR